MLTPHDTDNSPPGSRRRFGFWCIAIAAALIATDQIVKWLAIQQLPYGQPVATLVPGLDLQLVMNPGAAFGLGAQAGPLLGAGILVILIVLTVWIIRRVTRGENTRVTLLLTIIAAGGWGNMIDRIARADGVFLSGHVIDYLSISWFAIFNLADVFAVGGVLTICAINLLSRPSATSTRPHPEPQT